jgi:DNA-binding protein HU-beta
MGRNPFTGETIKIKASKKARFLPAKGLKEVISGERKLGPAPKIEAKVVAKAAPKKVAKKAAKKSSKKAAPKKAKKSAKKVTKKSTKKAKKRK